MAVEIPGDFVRDAMSRYRDPLLRYAASLVGESQAPDIVQDSFLALCQARPGELEGRLAPWLFCVCRNRALDIARERKRLQPITEEDDMASPESGPSSSLSRKQSLSRIQRSLHALPEKQRQALLLKFSGGLSYKEIAEVMELSVNHVGVILHTAIKKIREELTSEAAPDGVRNAL